MNGIYNPGIKRFEDLATAIGFTIEYKSAATLPEKQQILKNGEAIIGVDFSYDYNWANKYNVRISNPYSFPSSVCITKSGLLFWSALF